MQAAAPEWRDYEKFVAQMSWKSLRRAKASGLDLEFEDIFQEAAMAFVRARESFKPELGYKFITYCGAAISTALANYKIKQDRQLLGRTVSIDSLLGPDDDGYDIFPGGDTSPLNMLVLEDEMKRVAEALGPLGAQMVDWMIYPPQEVVEELEAFKWKIAEMNRRGLRRNSINIDVDMRFLFGELLPRLLPDNQAAIRRLRDQVQQTVDSWQI
jgi:Sigma-70 region 2